MRSVRDPNRSFRRRRGSIENFTYIQIELDRERMSHESERKQYIDMIRAHITHDSGYIRYLYLLSLSGFFPMTVITPRLTALALYRKPSIY